MISPDDLLDVARHLLPTAPGRPNNVYLRRAQSTIYYALFHCLCAAGANVLVGSSKQTSESWSRVYRALEHGTAHNAMLNQQTIKRFPKFGNFCTAFVDFQKKRHDADYDPRPARALRVQDIRNDLATADKVIRDFSAQPFDDQRDFIIHLLFKARS